MTLMNLNLFKINDSGPTSPENWLTGFQNLYIVGLIEYSPTVHLLCPDESIPTKMKISLYINQ
jgi:hypothetical protein